MPWFSSRHWVHGGIACTTTVPALATHRNLQQRVPSHGGSCPGVTTVPSTGTPQRPPSVPPPASHRCDHCGSCVFYISPWSLCAPTQATCSPIVSIAFACYHSGSHAQHHGGVVCPRATVAQGSQLQWLRRKLTVAAAGESDATVACSQPSPRCSTTCIHSASACPHSGACGYCIPSWPPSDAAVATAKTIVLWGPESAHRGPPGGCNGLLHLHGSTVANCTSMVPAHTVHSNLQNRVPSHGGSCPGTATVPCAWTPLRPTAITTVGIHIECRKSHCGRGAHPQGPRAAPSRPLYRFELTVESTNSAVVDWCAWLPTVAPGVHM